jgi:hypothetical protein
MPSYLVESYEPNRDDALADARAQAVRAAELEDGVRYVRTTFLPDDEVVLHMFEAPSPETLRDAARRAALAYERIVEAVELAGNRVAELPEGAG